MWEFFRTTLRIRDNTKIAIYATSCKMSVFFALDMTIGPLVDTRGPTCRVQKIDILLRVSYKIFFDLVTKSTHSD
jgi:hypothetical protein